MIKDKMWYAVYTKPRWEKKVASLLARKQIENYCPLNKVQRQWSDRKKIVLEPLFQSYVFVNISIKEQLLVRETSGVLNFVYWLQKPAVIRDEEINVIKKFLNEYHHVQLEKATVSLNDKVRIIGGPLMMREGNVLEVKNKTVKVLLPSMGYALIAEIEKINLEKVSKTVDGSQVIVF
ncbi:MAG: UpxY family transcription antiterminator [Chitinophagaceae bacterium]